MDILANLQQEMNGPLLMSLTVSTYVIIQHFVTLPKCGHGALNVRRQ